METLALRLRELRGYHSQKETARQLGISQHSLKAYEEGRRTPRDEVIQRAALYYHVPTTYLCQKGGRGNLWKS